MRMRITGIAVFAAVSRLLAAFSLLAAPSGWLFAAGEDFLKLQSAFIRTLYDEGRYFECIAETRRLMTYLPADRKRGLEHFINVNYYRAGQYRTVVRNLQPALTGLDHGSVLLYSQALARLGAYAEAVRALESAAPWPDGPPREEFYVRSVEIRALAGEFAPAFHKASEGAALYPDSVLPTLRDRLSAHDALRSRSKPLAAALSAALPGAGQAYAGRFADALWSVTAVLALGAGTALAWRGGHRDIAFTLGFFAVLAYGGNIYGAWNSAGEYNRAQTERFGASAVRSVHEYRPFGDGILPETLR